MVKKSTKKTQSKHVSKSQSKGYALPLHGFKERYLTWQIGDISENGARTLGTIRFIIFAFLLVMMIIALCMMPSYCGYFWI